MNMSCPLRKPYIEPHFGLEVVILVHPTNNHSTEICGVAGAWTPDITNNCVTKQYGEMIPANERSKAKNPFYFRKICPTTFRSIQESHHSKDNAPLPNQASTVLPRLSVPRLSETSIIRNLDYPNGVPNVESV